MPLPRATPTELDLDASRLQLAYQLLDQWTQDDPPTVPGGAILVGRRGHVVEPYFAGQQGPESDAEPIRDDGMFLIASLTKPITYLGAMLLVERGELNLCDHVTRYIPEFAAHHKEDTLVAHLFTHTSGLPDMLANNEQLRRDHAPLSQFIHGAIHDTIPLFPPGTNVKYQSMGTLIVAELIQRLSGQSIHDYLKQELFDRLGLDSIGLGSRGLDRERIVRVETPDYQAGGNFGWNSTYWQELGSPWGGMFSAPEDFGVLCQLMLDEGQFAGTRLLSPYTVRLMTTNRLHDFAEIPEPTRRTKPWGLGWQLNPVGTTSAWSDLLSREVFGHTGATGTMCWIDREREGFCVLFTTAIRSKAPWLLVQLSNIVASAFQ